MNLKETILLYNKVNKQIKLLYQRLVRDEKPREVLVSSLFLADNYAVAEEILARLRNHTL